MAAAISPGRRRTEKGVTYVSNVLHSEVFPITIPLLRRILRRVFEEAEGSAVGAVTLHILRNWDTTILFNNGEFFICRTS